MFSSPVATGKVTSSAPTATPVWSSYPPDGGGGYLAYVLGDRLLVKQFDDQPQRAAAPGEAEIELYVNPDHSYVEVETQGAYKSIAPGETITWKINWYARKLPAGVTASLGNPDLIAFAAKTLQ